MYAASFRTRCPMRNIEYTSEPMSVTAIKSGARIATKINKAPGVSVPVTIASHSWNWTRISVARKTPVPPHRSPKAIRSLRVDRAPDDREERLLQGHGPDGGGQVFAQRDVHDLVDPRRFHDHVQGVPLFDALAEGGELLPMVAAVLDRDAQRAADLPLRPFRGPFEQDRAFLDDVQPFRECLGFVEVMRRQEDRAPLSREVPEDVPHRASSERVESDRRLVQEQEGCLRRQDRGDHRSLLLPAGQGHRETIRHILEAHFLQRGFGPRLRLFTRQSARPKVAVHLLPRGEVEERLPLLGHDGDEGPHRFRRAHDIVPEHLDLSGRRDQQGRSNPKERRLAGAVATDQMWPNGSRSFPYRSPQNWFSSGMEAVAPAARAWSQSLSTSFVYTCRLNVVPPAELGDFVSLPGNSSDIITSESPILIIACISVPSGIPWRVISFAPNAFL